MKKMNVNEMAKVNGGYQFHCRVCHTYYNKGFWTTSSFFANCHVLSKKHRNAVKAIGYGHMCC